MVSNAERRALINHEPTVVTRLSDIYAALPSLTGKFELEYEGELKGADTVAREIIRQATARVFKKYFDGVPMHGIVQWFELGGNLKYAEGAPAEEIYAQFKKIQGLLEKTHVLGVKPKDDAGQLVAAGGIHFGRAVRAEEDQPQRGAGLPCRTPTAAAQRGADGRTRRFHASAPKAVELNKQESEVRSEKLE